MAVSVAKADLATIQPLRTRFLAEAARQVRYDATFTRGWCDGWRIDIDGSLAGYGLTKEDGREGERDTVFEFFLLPQFRWPASDVFPALLEASGAARIECQSNDPLLTPMLFEFATAIHSDTILFEAGPPAPHHLPNAVVRLRRDDDEVFAHQAEPPGTHVLEWHGSIVATGGYFTHYNPPFADIYMEVAPEHRRRGAGRLLVQEVMRACVAAGLVPAARCSVENVASRATLMSAGMRICGYMLAGTVKPRE